MASVIHDLLEHLDERVRNAVPRGGRFVAAVVGGVGAGKSTFAGTLSDAIARRASRPHVQVVPTDGYLYPNRVLAERGLSLRKGFPESYDVEALRSALSDIRRGARASIPRYSHVTYDVDPADRQLVDEAQIVILDGLHLGRVKENEGARLIDALIFLDAEESDIERWFHARLIPLMQAGRTDPNSFYYAFRTLDDDAVRAFSERVWREINLPNLRDHIVHDRDIADIVLRKRGDHSLESMRTLP